MHYYNTDIPRQRKTYNFKNTILHRMIYIIILIIKYNLKSLNIGTTLTLIKNNTYNIRFNKTTFDKMCIVYKSKSEKINFQSF